MKFKLTEDQLALQDMLRRIVTSAEAHDGLRAVIDDEAAFDTALWQRLAEFGALGIVVPEAHGGAGLTIVELGLLTEVLGYAGVPVPFFGHVLASLAIATAGSEEQQARLLPALAQGTQIATIALEGDRGWGPGNWTLAGENTVTGRLANVPHGMQADLLVFGRAGGGLGVLDLTNDQVARRAMDGLDRTRPLAVIEMDGAPTETLSADDKTGGLVYDAALALLAADAFGGASRCLEMAIEYGNLREAFGAKLTQFQGYKHQLANFALDVEPCRGLYWHAIYSCANLPERAPHAAALAKAHIGETFARVSRLAIELHGGIGFTWEHDAHIWMKRAMFDYAWGGGSSLHLRRAADLAGW